MLIAKSRLDSHLISLHCDFFKLQELHKQNVPENSIQSHDAFGYNNDIDHSYDATKV